MVTESQRERESERGVLSFESFDFGFCVFIVCRGSRVVWSGGVFVGAYDKFLYLKKKKKKKKCC